MQAYTMFTTNTNDYRAMQRDLKALKADPAQYGIFCDDFLVAFFQLKLNGKKADLQSYAKRAMALSNDYYEALTDHIDEPAIADDITIEQLQADDEHYTSILSTPELDWTATVQELACIGCSDEITDVADAPLTWVTVILTFVAPIIDSIERQQRIDAVNDFLDAGFGVITCLLALAEWVLADGPWWVQRQAIAIWNHPVAKTGRADLWMIWAGLDELACDIRRATQNSIEDRFMAMLG